MVVNSVNLHDTSLFDESFTNLLEITDQLMIDLQYSCLTLDSGFDSYGNKMIIENAGLIPVIKPNIRRNKNEIQINQILNEFEPYQPIYKQRYVIERCFAWEDTYRKLVIRYEKLQCTHLGFKHLAYSMINFRCFFNRNSSYSL